MIIRPLSAETQSIMQYSFAPLGTVLSLIVISIDFSIQRLNVRIVNDENVP